MTIAQALRNEGQRRGLQILLEERFGAVPDVVMQRINTAEAELMDAWLRRLVSARTLDEIFDGAR